MRVGGSSVYLPRRELHSDGRLRSGNVTLNSTITRYSMCPIDRGSIGIGPLTKDSRVVNVQWPDTSTWLDTLNTSGYCVTERLIPKEGDM